jgi:predicted RNA-binding Zn ribbon-like protein
MAQRALEGSVQTFLQFDLDGGQLALDFANTVDWRKTDKEHEWLNEYTDLLAWSMRVGLLDKNAAEALAARAAREPAEAQRVLLGARELRELLFRVFNAVIEGSGPEPTDWRAFNQAVRAVMASAVVGQKEGRFYWSFDQERQRRDFFRGPVVKAATDLLIGGDLTRLKRCSTPDCQWLFLDTSKNKSRRWCDMQSCGNRAKAKRYYQKSRKTSGGP